MRVVGDVRLKAFEVREVDRRGLELIVFRVEKTMTGEPIRPKMLSLEESQGGWEHGGLEYRVL